MVKKQKRIHSLNRVNGHRMEASYNAYGEMIPEKWYDTAEASIAHYRYALYTERKKSLDAL